MKKIIISVLTVLFSICMIVPLTVEAYTIDDIYDGTQMDYEIWNYINNSLMPAIESNGNGNGASQESVNNVQNSINNVQNSVNSIDVKKDIDEYINEKSKENAEKPGDHPAKSFTDSVIKVIEDMWGEIPDYLMNDNKLLNSFTLDIKGLKNSTIYGIFVNVGYSLVLLFFAANLIENTIKYEIFTLKGGAMLFGRLIISKVVIDLSGTICIYILNICTKITTAIFDESGNMLKWNIPTIGEIAKSVLPFGVGELVDLITTIIMIIPVIIIAIAMISAASIIMIKLVLRSLELSLLIVVSPAFFACYSSEITKPYFKNFIITFIQCAVQLVFMAVVYYIGTRFGVSAATPETFVDLVGWFLARSQVAIIALAIAIMMVKPPKVLTNLIK